MDKRQRPTRVADTLERVIQRFDPDQRMKVYRLWTFWDEEVGEAVAAHAQPAGFRAEVLSVRVDSPSWMQELQFLKEGIRERLNRRLGEELIRDIYFVSGKRQKTKPARAPATAPRPRAAVALPKIHDGELAAVFKRIARAHRDRGED
jgi:predicted nucleic acid-binding Zn ribbon protein